MMNLFEEVSKGIMRIMNRVLGQDGKTGRGKEQDKVAKTPESWRRKVKSVVDNTATTWPAVWRSTEDGKEGGCEDVKKTVYI
jgi:hypothetical protein